MRYDFSGTYGPSLLEEVYRYAEVASVLAHKYDFDIIHAHDWLTYPAGVEAKKASGKPLIVHVHATEFDRAGDDNIDQRVFELEKMGMSEADRIIAVSQWTKDIIVDKYGIDPLKVSVVHNGVIASEGTEFSFLPKIRYSNASGVRSTLATKIKHNLRLRQQIVPIALPLKFTIYAMIRSLQRKNLPQWPLVNSLFERSASLN